MSRKPDPYAEFRALAMTLEGEGVAVDTIIDAAFRVALHGAIRTSGRQAAAQALLDAALRTEKPDRTPPVTAH